MKVATMFAPVLVAVLFGGGSVSVVAQVDDVCGCLCEVDVEDEMFQSRWDAEGLRWDCRRLHIGKYNPTVAMSMDASCQQYCTNLYLEDEQDEHGCANYTMVGTFTCPPSHVYHTSCSCHTGERTSPTCQWSTSVLGTSDPSGSYYGGLDECGEACAGSSSFVNFCRLPAGTSFSSSFSLGMLVTKADVEKGIGVEMCGCECSYEGCKVGTMDKYDDATRSGEGCQAFCVEKLPETCGALPGTGYYDRKCSTLHIYGEQTDASCVCSTPRCRHEISGLSSDGSNTEESCQMFCNTMSRCSELGEEDITATCIGCTTRRLRAGASQKHGIA